jgi:hypothetical protein
MSSIRAGTRRAEETSFPNLAISTEALTTSVEPERDVEFGSVATPSQLLTATRRTVNKMVAAFVLMETPKKYFKKKEK